MSVSELLDNLTKKLNASGIHPLRQLGRAVGVYSPTNKKKEELIADILAIASNRADPAPMSHRGAPPKSEDFDKELQAEVERCRRYYSGLTLAETIEELPAGKVAVASPEEDDGQVYSGILENADKYWFVRTKNMQISSAADVFVHSSFVNRFRLRTGDFIVCKAKKRREDECPGATFIISVNGVTPDNLRRVPFDALTPCYPDSRYTLEHENCSLTERVIDLFSPVGKGQRALIVSPPKAGKTTILKHIAQAIIRNYPSAKVIIALIDERPEEVTDIRRTVEGAEIAYSTFDKDDAHHMHTANLAIEHAKRLVESGSDVVVLLDSITRLARAYNNSTVTSGKILTGGLDPQALVEPKKFFGCARNTEEGGSLTIIATALVDTGSKLDDIIYEEFKSTGNMEIILSRELAEKRVFPAINIKSSGARREELLLSPAELEAATAVRSALGRTIRTEDVLAEMQASENNAQFVARSSQFLTHVKR